MAKKAVKRALTEMTLLYLAVFFMLVAVFVVLMYYRQAQMFSQYLRYQNEQQNAILKAVPTATPKAIKK